MALPLHPEYRTLPMVWYVPPLSPVMSMIEGKGSDADADDVFEAIAELRIPIQYLANLLTAGNEEPVRLALNRLAAMRRYMREQNLGAEPDRSDRRGGRPLARDDRAHVPTARDREVRGALCHPAGAPRVRAGAATCRARARSRTSVADDNGASFTKRLL